MKKARKKKKSEEEAEAEEEEVALDLGEVFEIDPRMLKMELRKLRKMREATEGSPEATDMADAFGGGEVEDESFIDVDEDDLLNALADELGDPGVPTPTVESRRRQKQVEHHVAEEWQKDVQHVALLLLTPSAKTERSSSSSLK